MLPSAQEKDELLAQKGYDCEPPHESEADGWNWHTRKDRLIQLIREDLLCQNFVIARQSRFNCQ